MRHTALNRNLFTAWKAPNTRHCWTQPHQKQRCNSKSINCSAALEDDDSVSESDPLPLLVLPSLSLPWKYHKARLSINSLRVGCTGSTLLVSWLNKRKTAIAWAQPPIGRSPHGKNTVYPKATGVRPCEKEHFTGNTRRDTRLQRGAFQQHTLRRLVVSGWGGWDYRLNL